MYDDARPSQRRLPKWLVTTAGLVVVVSAAAGVYVFEPHKLFLDEAVYEELSYESAPPAAPGAADAGVPVPVAPGPVAVATGEFSSLEHPTSGSVVLIRQPDGTHVVRLENLRTDNGPDLHLVLSPHRVGSGDFRGLIELGGLKGNIGDQNYEVPAGVDLAGVESVVVWCERFSSAFGEAPLTLG
jgi:hypothetical protein